MSAIAARLGSLRPRPLSPEKRREAITFYLVVAPWVIGFIIFTLGPMLASLVLSFTQWDMLSSPEWLGLQNYSRMFGNDADFRQALKVTAVYSVFSVPLRLLTALFLAMLLNEATRAVGLFRTAFYLPSIVASVAAAVLWSWILNPKFGPINGTLSFFGLKGPGWFADPDWALEGLILMSTWGVGGEMLIFLAGLKSIPQHLYEAAEIDGAGAWHKFRNVTIPMLTPTIFFNFVMSLIGAFKAFDSAFVISTARGGTLGGPAKSTLLYMLYLYQHAFRFFNMGYATALAWVLFLITLAFTLFVVRSSALWVYYEGEKK